MAVRIPIRLLATVAVAGALTATIAGAIAATALASGSGPPVNGTAPSIKGKTLDGAKLKGLSGTWTGAPSITHAFAWERCDSSGASCEPISGAATNTYRATPTDVGHRLVVVVTASNGAGSSEARSAPSAVIGPRPPRHKGKPVLSGQALDGRLLTVGSVTWTGTAPFTYTYQWIRCGKGCAPIAGASESSYRLTTADIGKKIKALVTAKNAAGSNTVRSVGTAKVLPGSPLDLALPRAEGTPLVGQTLTAENGTWVGTPPITYTYQWYACSMSGCEAIAGQTEPTHEIGIGEFGENFEIEVKATNAQGSAAATSEQTNVVGGNSPLNKEAPSISGTPTAGQLLTASSGKWSGSEPITYEYEWLRCNASGAECTQAAAPSVLPVYSVAAADAGHTLRVKVIAKNLAGTGEAESEPTATVSGVKPSNVLAPTVLGLDITGQTLTATEGTWTGTEPITYGFQWQQCSKAGTECEDISGESKSTYVIRNADAAHTLRVLVTATNVAGSVEKESAVTGEVVGVGPENTEAPAISGTATAGQLLTASSGKWSGTEPIAYEYEWLRCNTSGSSCTQAAPPSLLPVYTVAAADVGHTLRVNVLAKNIAGTGSAESEPTTTVAGVTPSNVLAPTVLGLDITGQTLTATEGTWTGTEPITYSFQWQQCSKAGAECKNIGGETKSTYVIKDGDATHTLRVLVTAKNVAGATEKESAVTGEVVGVGPENTEAPAISGTATAGQLLTASSGKWSGTEPIAYEYEWLRCNTSGSSCTQAAAPSLLPTYSVAGADVGHKLRVKVLAKNIAGSGSAESEPTATVGGVTPSNTLAPTVLGLDITGQTLTATEGTWTGTEPITYSFQWQQCSKAGTECKTIGGETKSTYVIQNSDASHTLRVLVTAKNVAGSAEKESAVTGEVLGVAPKNTEAPGISGTTTAGQLLTASSGKWTGTEPIAYEYEWLRCNTSGSSCTQAAAPSLLPTYSVAGADVGHKLRVKVLAKNIAGSGSAESEPTATVGGVKPSNTLAPTVLGLDITGQTLTATEGTWTGTEPITYSFQWQQCSKAGTECKNIGGETKSTYVIKDGDAAHTLRVIVTAENVAGSTEKESSVTGEVTGVAPKSTEAPGISGEAKAGALLTASSGKWSGTEPITYSYEWLRCNTSGAECSRAQESSLLPTYTAQGADVGKTLRVKVTATNIAGSASAESERTATVTGVKPSNTLAPTVLGLDITGQTLTATEGTWTGTEPITYSFQWQQCSKVGTECKNITGETKSTYVIQNGDAAHTLRVLVTAKNVAGSTEKESAVTGEVLGVAPKNTEAPGISGEAKEGVLLTASSGKWSGTEPITYEYEWLRCNTSGASCTQAAAASLLPTYTAVAADVGKTLRVKVKAKNIAGTESAESEKTEPVKGILPANTVLPVTVPLVSTTSGSTVTATEGTWTGTQPITYEWEWKICTTATSCKVEQKGTSHEFKVPGSSGGKKLRVNVIAKNAAGKGEKEALELSILL